MGTCASSAAGGAAHRDEGAEQASLPRCVLCGLPSGQPLRKLSKEGREEWVEMEGSPCHRRCLVSHKLEEARYHKDRVSYTRAKAALYPLPTVQLHRQQHGGELHRVESEQEWACSESFRQPYHPSEELVAKERCWQQQQERQRDAELAAALAAALLRQLAQQQQQQQQRQQQQQQQQPAEQQEGQRAQVSCGEEDQGSEVTPLGVAGPGQAESSRSSLSSTAAALTSRSRSSSSSSGGMSLGAPGQGSMRNQPSSSGSGIGSAQQVRRISLRRLSPVHYPALQEAKMHRRLTGPHPSFDSEAMQADADGKEGGKAWRAQCKAEAAEAGARAARSAAEAANCNGF